MFAGGLCFEIGVGDDGFEEVWKIDFIEGEGVGGVFDAAEVEDALDEGIEAFGFVFDAIEGGGGGGLPAGFSDGEMEASERGTDFVGDVLE